jgi:hypothetical protein
MQPNNRMEATPGDVVAMVLDLAAGAPHPERSADRHRIAASEVKEEPPDHSSPEQSWFIEHVP